MEKPPPDTSWLEWEPVGRRPWWLGRYLPTALLDIAYTLWHRLGGTCPWCREP